MLARSTEYVFAYAMRYRPLGRTELMVSEIGFGGHPIGGLGWGGVTDENSLAALQRAFDLGINFFDTADIYGHGHSEELIGQALAEVRPHVLIATKVGLDDTHGGFARSNFAPAYIRRAVEKSLERLRTDYIDLYQLHNPPQKLTKDDAVWETLANLQRQGAIRYYGVSSSTANDARAYLRASEATDDRRRFGDTLQVAYNILDQEAAAKGIFIEAHRQGWGVISRVPLASGLLAGQYSADHRFPSNDFRSGWAGDRLAETVRRVEALRSAMSGDLALVQASLAFVLSQPTVSTVIVGARTSAQIEETAEAGDHVPLPDEALRAAYDLYSAGFPEPSL